MKTVAVQSPAVPSVQVPDAHRSSGATFAEALAATGQASPPKGHEACPGKWPPGHPSAEHRMTGPPSDAQCQGDPTDPVQKVDARSKTTGEPEASKNTEPAAQVPAVTINAIAAVGAEIVAAAAQSAMIAPPVAMATPAHSAQTSAQTADAEVAGRGPDGSPVTPTAGDQQASAAALELARPSSPQMTAAVAAVPDDARTSVASGAVPPPTSLPTSGPEAGSIPTATPGLPIASKLTPAGATPQFASVPVAAMAPSMTPATVAQPDAPGVTPTNAPADGGSPVAAPEAGAVPPMVQPGVESRSLPQLLADEVHLAGPGLPVNAGATPPVTTLATPVHPADEPAEGDTQPRPDVSLLRRPLTSQQSDVTNRMERAAVLGVSDTPIANALASARPFGVSAAPMMAAGTTDGAASLPAGTASETGDAQPQFSGPSSSALAPDAPNGTPRRSTSADTTHAPSGAGGDSDPGAGFGTPASAATAPGESQQLQQAQTSPTTGPAAPAARMAAEAPAAPSSAAAHVERAQATQQVMDRIEMMRVAGGRQESTLHLRPDHLGSLRITVVSEGDQVTARIVAESSSTRQMLQDEREQLRQGLAERGYNLQHLDVGSGGAGPGARHQTAARDAQWAATVRQDTVRSADATAPTGPQRVAAPMWAGRLDCTA